MGSERIGWRRQLPPPNLKLPNRVDDKMNGVIIKNTKKQEQGRKS